VGGEEIARADATIGVPHGPGPGELEGPPVHLNGEEAISRLFKSKRPGAEGQGDLRNKTR
jgi:hypothetical protein